MEKASVCEPVITRQVDATGMITTNWVIHLFISSKLSSTQIWCRSFSKKHVTSEIHRNTIPSKLPGWTWPRSHRIRRDWYRAVLWLREHQLKVHCMAAIQDWMFTFGVGVWSLLVSFLEVHRSLSPRSANNHRRSAIVIIVSHERWILGTVKRRPWNLAYPQSADSDYILLINLSYCWLCRNKRRQNQ